MKKMGRFVALDNFKKNHKKRRFDTLIAAYSYEDRVVDSIKRSIRTFNVRRVVLFVYDGETYLDKPTIEKWQINRERIRQLLDSYGISIDEIPCKHDDITEVHQYLQKVIELRGTVLIDITCFTKNYILKLAKIFDFEHLFDSQDILFFYTRSKMNRVPTPEEMAVSIDRIEPVKGFEGYINLDRNDLVVLILGYEGNRSLAFLRKFETEPTFAMIGAPYVKDNNVNRLYRDSAEAANTRLLNIHRVICYEKPVHSLDPFLFAQDLEVAINNYHNIKGHNICLSCLGTKLQMLGVYLYWKRNPSCQILYSVPNKRFDISSGTGKSWVIEFQD